MAKKKSRTLADFLAEPLPIPELEPNVGYERTHDDHDGEWKGRIQVSIINNRDVIVTTDQHRGDVLRFRQPMMGGTRSPRVWNALRILAYAIKLDSEEFPEHRPPGV